MMLHRRRLLLHLAATAAASSFMPQMAWPQAYPARPVRLIVGFAPGGTTDIVARLIAQWLSERLGRQFIVENRAGANTGLAIEALVRAPADGYTLGTLGTSTVLNSTLYPHLNVDLSRDLAYVAGLNASPLVLVVHPALPASNVTEFIAYAKANPGKISLASFGTASISHVAGELFKRTAGIDTTHVPYRGSGPMLVDLLSGQVQAAFDNLPASIEYIRAGNLRALAVTTAARSEALPQIPPMADYLPGFEVSAFVALAAPKNTPREIVSRLNEAINLGLADARMKQRLVEQGAAPLVLSPAELGQLVDNQRQKYAQIIRDAQIKAE
jgi:tripartite-type tricarboxylate transporter receptor subunit TctC